MQQGAAYLAGYNYSPVDLIKKLERNKKERERTKRELQRLKSENATLKRRVDWLEGQVKYYRYALFNNIGSKGSKEDDEEIFDAFPGEDDMARTKLKL